MLSTMSGTRWVINVGLKWMETCLLLAWNLDSESWLEWMLDRLKHNGVHSPVKPEEVWLQVRKSVLSPDCGTWVRGTESGLLWMSDQGGLGRGTERAPFSQTRAHISSLLWDVWRARKLAPGPAFHLDWETVMKKRFLQAGPLEKRNHSHF